MTASIIRATSLCSSIGKSKRVNSPSTRKTGGDPEDKCKSEALFLTQKSNSLLISIVISETVKFTDKAKVTASIIDFYKRQADLYEKEKRRSKAAEVYEKLLTMKISDSEKEFANKKLMDLYKTLGMIDKYIKIKEAPSKTSSKPAPRYNDYDVPD